MTPEVYQQQIDEFKLAIERLTEQHKFDQDYKNDIPWDERRILSRKFGDARKKLEGKITYRENKLAAMDGPPVHKDIFGQTFAVGQRVAWSSSSKYAGARLGWVVGITPKMISVANTWAANEPFKADAHGTALMPKALIICDAIVQSQITEERPAPDGYFWREDL